jgi:hypothetical protein
MLKVTKKRFAIKITGANSTVEVIVNNFQKAIQKLNALLKKRKPKTFNPEWIKQNSKSVYAHLFKNFQTETGEIDWDSITVRLEPTFQKRWKRYEKKVPAVAYEDREELDFILAKYKDKLYTLIAPLCKEDKQIQDQIMIRLVRLAQKGNTLAKEYVAEFLTIIIYEWIENSKFIARWKGHTNGIEKRIDACIRNYRYSGSFMGYVFRSFQCFARGLRPIVSLNDRFLNGKKERIDYVIQEDSLCA